MFAAIFYWDYPPLHQSSAELVLWGLTWELTSHGKQQVLVKA